jgi:hypothetical protein
MIASIISYRIGFKSDYSNKNSNRINTQNIKEKYQKEKRKKKQRVGM